MRHGCPLEAVACQDPEEEQRVEAEGDEGTPLPRCALALSGKRTGSTGTDSELNNLPDYKPPAARFRTCDRPMQPMPVTMLVLRERPKRDAHHALPRSISQAYKGIGQARLTAVERWPPEAVA
jgi:hypothetical protein